jgi:hypothetical protein
MRTMPLVNSSRSSFQKTATWSETSVSRKYEPAVSVVRLTTSSVTNASASPARATTAQATFDRSMKNGVSSTPTIAAMSHSSATNGRSSSQPGMNGVPIAAREMNASLVIVDVQTPLHVL